MQTPDPETWPQQLTIDDLVISVRIEAEKLEAITLIQTPAEWGPSLSITTGLADLDNLVGVLLAARTKLREIRKDRDDKTAAARDFVMRVGGLEAARAALAAADAS